MIIETGELSKNVGDVAGLGIVLATWADYLPTIATALTAVWFVLRIVETLQNIYYRRRQEGRLDDKNKHDNKGDKA